jgi:WD40 repeat protein
MHTAPIDSIAADAADRYLVTGGEDKALRVWDIATGDLLQTLRIPIGPGREGAIKAVAITPDGAWIAASGWTGNDRQEQFSIYVLDRITGKLRVRIGELPSTINKLAFSPDGTRLAAALGGGSGVRIFEAMSGRELSRDTGFAGNCPALDFDSAGRLAVAAYDGFLRLYDSNGKLINKTAVPGGGETPNDIAFSSDGQRLAVSYGSTSEVDIFSGSNLRLLSVANPGDQEDSFIRKVEWSRKSGKLFVVAKTGADRLWGVSPLPFHGPVSHIPQGSVAEILSLPDGRWVFGSDKPSWGILTENGRTQLIVPARTADFSGNEASPGLLVNTNAHRIRFVRKSLGAPSSSTLIISDTLTLGGSIPMETLESPKATAPGLRVTEWYETSEPAVNGRVLSLDALDISHSADVAEDGEFFVLGTDISLRSFDKLGRKRWRIDPPAPTRAVNISYDKRLVVGAFGDGTIRWFRADNGQELLAFFPHSDGKRWVAWTPSGYYDASVGGEDLIGWHVNRGPDEAADFFPVSRFHDRYYRPGVVARVLDTLNEDKAVAEADAEAQRKPDPPAISQLLPPVVTVLAPAGDTTFHQLSIPFRVTVRSPSGEPVIAVRALVDGRPAGSARGLVYEPRQQAANSDTEQIYTFSVAVPQRDCTVAITAETRLAVSEPVPVRLHWATRIAQAPAPISTKPKLYVLSIGVGTYSNPAFNLEFPAKDARDITTAWKSQAGKLYGEVQARFLTDAEATKNGIFDGLEWLERETTAQDVAVLYFSGHGVNNPRDGEYLFLPYEADSGAMLRTMLPGREIRGVLSSIPGKVLLFLDTCHSGNLFGKAKGPGASDLTGLINELTSAENGVVVFSASTGRQSAIESDELKNGAFTLALVEALTGKADLDGDHSLYITEIENYLARRVKELTRGLQTPVVAKPGGMPDFPVAVW